MSDYNNLPHNKSSRSAGKTPQQYPIRPLTPYQTRTYKNNFIVGRRASFPPLIHPDGQTGHTCSVEKPGQPYFSAANSHSGMGVKAVDVHEMCLQFEEDFGSIM